MFTLPNPIFLTVFFLILSIRLTFISLYATDFPIWDSWSEVRELFIPWVNGTLVFSDIFAAHNEHRIVLTRLFNLAMFKLNGGMSPKLVMGAQAVITAFTGAFLVSKLLIPRSSFVSYILSLVVILSFCHLIGYENMLWDFQSQFFFLILFSLLTLWYAVNLKPDNWLCFLKLGLAIVFLCLSMSSAFVAVAVSGAFFIYRGIFGSRSKKFFIILGSGFLVLSALLFKFLVRHVPAHDSLRAKDLNSFLWSFFCNMGWPNSLFTGVGLVWIAIGALSILYILFTRKQFSRISLYGALLLTWSLIMQAAMAFNRGSNGVFPASRYSDCIAIALVGSCFLLYHFLHRFPYKKFFVLAFALFVFSTLLSASSKLLPAIQKDKADKFRMETFARNALTMEKTFKGNGEAIIKAGVPLITVPYPSPHQYWEALMELPAKYHPVGMRPYRTPTEARYGPNRPLTNGTGVVYGASESNTGFLVGSYIAGDRWKGTITFGTMPVSSRYLKFFMMGYLSPGQLSLKVVSLPSKHLQIIEQGSPTESHGETIWPLEIELPEGTTDIQVSLADHSSKMFGWTAFAGIRELHRLSWVVENMGEISVCCLFVSCLLAFGLQRSKVD